jgi:hypothetical protein
VGLLALFSNSFATKTKQGLLSNGKLYKRLGGSLGSCVSLLRFEGSKIIYEIAKTLPTFSNAALAGAFEPKQKLISKILSRRYYIFSRIKKN